MSRTVLCRQVGGPAISAEGTCTLPHEGTFLGFLTHDGGTTCCFLCWLFPDHFMLFLISSRQLSLGGRGIWPKPLIYS